MTIVFAVFKRELSAYFFTPLAGVFLVVFLAALGAFTFYVGHFYDNGIADLSVFFLYHPWLHMFLVPALSMRLWAEERQRGTQELAFAWPAPIWCWVVGKFLAAWFFVGLALALTFPLWISVNLIAAPDNGVIVAGYVGSLLLAGGYLAIGSCLSSLTDSLVVAFIMTLTACLLLTVAAAPVVLDALHPYVALAAVVGALGALPHYFSMVDGVLDLRDVVYFLSLIGLFLFATVVFVDIRRGGR